MTQQAASLLEDLVATPSPSGQEQQAADVLSEHLEKRGLETWQDAIGNVHARAGEAEGPTVLLLGHLDTVPGQLPVRWEEEHAQGDVLHGRGAVDAKGPLVAHALALASLPADIGLDVHLVGAVGEEEDGRGARHLAETTPPPEAVLIAEPTGQDTIALGYRGRAIVEVQASVEPTHPGEPSPTAAERLLDAIDTLTERTGNPDRAVGFEQTTLRVLELSTEAGPNREQARARVDVRFPGAVPDIAAAAPALEDVQIRVTDACPGVRSSPRHPLATAMRGALRAAGHGPRTVVKTGTSDWNVLAQAWEDIGGLAYGPGDPALDHTPQERIAVDAVLEAADVLADALARVASEHLCEASATA